MAKGKPITPTEAKNSRPSDIRSSTVNDLYEEAKLWLEPGFKIETEAQAEGIKQLQGLARGERIAAEDDKGVEKRPHLDANTEIEKRYQPIVAKAQRIVDGCAKVLTEWNTAVEKERLRQAEETRRAAEEAAQRAAQAAASAKGDLGAMEIADNAIEDAKRLTKTAAKLERDASKGTGMRTIWDIEIADRKAALYHYLAKQPEKFVELLLDLARKDVGAGSRDLPGFYITSHKENI